MQQKKNNSSKAYIIAFIAMGVVVVLYSLIFKLYRWQHYLIAAGIALLVGRIVFIMAQGLDTSKEAPVQQVIPKTGDEEVDSLVEKPAPEDAPSNLAVFGRYLLSPRVMELLADVEPGVGGEIQLTDALDAVLKEEEMYALVIDPSDGFDTGTVESWLETNNILFNQR